MPVQLTALGRETAEAAFREDKAVEAELLKGLDEAELKELARRLAKGVDGGEGVVRFAPETVIAPNTDV